MLLNLNGIVTEMDLKLPYRQSGGVRGPKEGTRSAYTREEGILQSQQSIRKMHFELDRSLDTLFKEAPKKREKIWAKTMHSEITSPLNTQEFAAGELQVHHRGERG